MRTLPHAALRAAADAVVAGSARQEDFDLLSARVAAEGIECVAASLGRDARGPSRAWWRCTLRLCAELPRDDALSVTRELLAIEADGGGPAFEMERHALQVSHTRRWLEEHLRRVLDGSVTRQECAVVEAVLRAVRVAKAEERVRE